MGGIVSVWSEQFGRGGCSAIQWRVGVGGVAELSSRILGKHQLVQCLPLSVEHGENLRPFRVAKSSTCGVAGTKYVYLAERALRGS